MRSEDSGTGERDEPADDGTAERIGESPPLASVTDDEIGQTLELLRGSSAVNTWNTCRSVVLSWTAWCAASGYDGRFRPGRGDSPGHHPDTDLARPSSDRPTQRPTSTPP